MTLVHESTHGYIASRGCSYEEHRRAQIERICVRAEIAFARRLPDPGNLVAEAEAVLNFPSEFWRSEAFSERNIKRLEVINAPRWMVNHLRNRRAKEDQQTSPPQGSQLISRVRASVPRAEGSEDLEPDRRIDL